MRNKETKRTPIARRTQGAADDFRTWDLVSQSPNFDSDVRSLADNNEQDFDATAYFENAINNAVYEYAQLTGWGNKIAWGA